MASPRVGGVLPRGHFQSGVLCRAGLSRRCDQQHRLTASNTTHTATSICTALLYTPGGSRMTVWATPIWDAHGALPSWPYLAQAAAGLRGNDQ